MRGRLAALVACSLLVACGRSGYEVFEFEAPPQGDSGHSDSGALDAAAESDAALADNAGGEDEGRIRDAGQLDSLGIDNQILADEAGRPDLDQREAGSSDVTRSDIDVLGLDRGLAPDAGVLIDDGSEVNEAGLPEQNLSDADLSDKLTNEASAGDQGLLLESGFGFDIVIRDRPGLEFSFGVDTGPGPGMPVAARDSFRTLRNTDLAVRKPGVLLNDSDPDDDPLRPVLAADASNGLVAFTGDEGGFTYSPDNGFIGIDTFSYRASDGFNLSNLAEVEISVSSGSNDPPVGVADSASMPQGVGYVGSPGVLENDSDPDGDPLFAYLDTAPVVGDLMLDGDGSFIYLPPSNFSGFESFSYRAFDGMLYSALVTVTLEVVPEQN